MVINDDFDKKSLYLDNYKQLPRFNIYKQQDFGSKSNEVYFGKTSPLSMILISYCSKLKDLLGDSTKKYNFKDKDFVKKIKTLCNNFGAAIATELNVESCTVQVALDKELNAFCVPLFTCFDNRPVNKNGNPIDYKIDLDKYVDLENIVQTKIGYKFKKATNKLLFININIGMIWKASVEEMAAVICHEIGHCFQQGIFGTYKNYSDLLYQKEVQNYDLRMREITGVVATIFTFAAAWFLPLGPITIVIVLVILFFFPTLINLPGIQNIRFAIEKVFKHRIVDEKTFKMKEKLDKMDNETISQDEKDKIDYNGKYDTSNRKKLIKEEIDANYKSYDKINLYKKEKEAKQSIWKGFIAIFYDFSSRNYEFWSVVNLSRYARNYRARKVFYKKYEFFADIFASAYGFGPEMYRNLINFDKYSSDEVEKNFDTGIYKVPIIKAMALYNNYNYMRDLSAIDEHGETHERTSAMYTNLINEIKTNPDLTPAQKKAIQEDCEMYHKLDQKYYETMKKEGILYKVFNKTLEKKVTKQDKTVEELVLAPILEVAKESFNKKK